LRVSPGLTSCFPVFNGLQAAELLSDLLSELLSESLSELLAELLSAVRKLGNSAL